MSSGTADDTTQGSSGGPLREATVPGDSATNAALPEYGVNPFLRGEGESPFTWAELRERYGWVRGYFKSRPRQFRELQRWLNQAQIGETYDQYMARAVRYAGIAAVLGILLGFLVAVVLGQTGILPQLRSPILFYGDLGEFVATYRLQLAAAAVTIVVSAVIAVLTLVGMYYYPLTIVDRRRRTLDIVLPHAIVFMYALSHGGTSLIEIIRKMADQTDTYSEVANEFESIQRDIDLFGNDLSTALQNQRNVTPSDSMEQFLDDLLSVIDSGGDVTLFFENQSEKYLEEAKEEQESFLETLAVLSEFFIALFVAAPLFLIVTLMVVSLIGGETLNALSAIIYLVLPLGMAGFLVLIDTLSAPYVQVRTEKREHRDPELDELASSLSDDVRLKHYASQQRRLAVKRFLSDPLQTVRERPLTSLYVTVPAAISTLVFTIALGFVTPTAAAFTETPVVSTIRGVVVPVFIVAVPLSWYHERKRSREKNLTDRFPDALNIISSANKMGIQFTEALELVARWSTSKTVGVQLRRVRNDILWNHDIRAALLAFSDRLSVPQLSRTIKLIAEGNRSSSDLSAVLRIAADDARERAKIERARRRELGTYTAIVIIGFLVYLLVIVILNESYLAPISSVEEPTGEAARNFPVGLGGIPVDTYRTMFFHSALVQGFGSGLLAGKLSDNSVLSGLKYGILLVAIALAAFAFV